MRKEPILLKEINKEHDVVEVIEFPHDEGPFLSERRQMFQEYLERGLLLTKEEFTKVTRKYSPQGELDFAQYRKDYPSSPSRYPKELTTQKQHIDYIKKQHPELAFYFDLARIYDEKGGTSDVRQRVLLETVENSLFDRLIGEAIYSRDQFQKFLTEKEFSSVFTIDLKFIKELNEKTTYADADMAIKSVWEKIRSSLGQDEREKLIIGRFGGTFTIGVRKGMSLAPKTEEALQNITNLSLNLNKESESFSIPVSTTKYSIPSDGEDSQFLFKNILQENEDQFYRMLFLDTLAEDMMDYTFIPLMKTFDNASMLDDYRTGKVKLYSLFLNGKRKVERSPKFLAAYRCKQTATNPDYSTDFDALQRDLTVYMKATADVSLETLMRKVDKLKSTSQR